MSNRKETSTQKAYEGFYPVIAPLIMGFGIGDGKTTSCVMAQAATIDALRNGQTLAKPTDEMECACPILRKMAIRANDNDWWKSDEERTEHLRPLIPLLLDSRASKETTMARLTRITNAAIFELTPMKLEWIASNSKSEEMSKKIREGIKTINGIGAIKDKASSIKARDILKGLSADACGSAYASAYASADAYASAYADLCGSAYDSAYASVSADACGSAYASAYVYSYASSDADVSAQKVKYRAKFFSLFRELAAIKD